MQAPSTHQWFKSSYSGGSGTECVECAYVTGGALIRDSKRTDGPLVSVATETWLRFVGALSDGGLRSTHRA
ncbi:DUF397 domain-containing protein [Streptomyces sp. NPDC050803]|uniref:DUF397 domain-containing protein n=1 Tax=unclassified Streptomyces TaxID=2593676 RepID=UPI00342F76EB